MFGGPIPPVIGDKLELAIVAARIVLTAGVAAVVGEAASALATQPGWAAAVFAITASTVSFPAWYASGRIVPAAKP